MAVAGFPEKLDLVLKTLSVSRGRLAAQLGVDKSLVSRWASGVNTPAAHNLSALTALIAERREGFTLLDWDRDLAELADRMGAPAPNLRQGSPDKVAELVPWLEVSRRQSRLEVSRDGMAYPGLYVGFRQAFRNSGEIIGDLIIIWRRDENLLVRMYDPAFSHRGEALILRHQLFVVCEDEVRRDGLMTYVLNGVSGQKAVRLDGLVLSVHGDRYRTPGASPIVLQRLSDLSDPETPPAEEELAAVLNRLRALFEIGALAEVAGQVILDAINPKVGAPLAGGGIDHLMRIPVERSIAASDLDWSDALATDVRRLRRALIEKDDCFPVFVEHALAGRIG